MTKKFEGVFYDKVAGYMGVKDDKSNVPASQTTVLEWFPLWDHSRHEFLTPPDGTYGCLVCLETHPCATVHQMWWNSLEQSFFWDDKCMDPVYDQVYGIMRCWCLEPEAPDNW